MTFVPIAFEWKLIDKKIISFHQKNVYINNIRILKNAEIIHTNGNT